MFSSDHLDLVVMAVNKYMNRIIAASDADLGEEDERLPDSHLAARKHDHTYGSFNWIHSCHSYENDTLIFPVFDTRRNHK